MNKQDEIKEVVNDLNNKFYGPHDFVQTSPCGRGQHHLHGYVEKLFRISDPRTVRIGDCFLKGRIKKGDLFLCTKHSGDCFQDYIFVEEYGNGFRGKPEWRFGSYGIGDSEVVEITEREFQLLKIGEFVKRPISTQ